MPFFSRSFVLTLPLNVCRFKGEGANWIPDNVRSELKLREKPVRMVSAIMIDCELDVLEIRLMELYVPPLISRHPCWCTASSS